MRKSHIAVATLESVGAWSPGLDMEIACPC